MRPALRLLAAVMMLVSHPVAAQSKAAQAKSKEKFVVRG